MTFAKRITVVDLSSEKESGFHVRLEAEKGGKLWSRSRIHRSRSSTSCAKLRFCLNQGTTIGEASRREEILER